MEKCYSVDVYRYLKDSHHVVIDSHAHCVPFIDIPTAMSLISIAMSPMLITILLIVISFLSTFSAISLILYCRSICVIAGPSMVIAIPLIFICKSPILIAIPLISIAMSLICVAMFLVFIAISSMFNRNFFGFHYYVIGVHRNFSDDHYYFSDCRY